MEYTIELVGSPKRWSIAAGQMRVGRDPECEIQVPEFQGVSREHVIIEATPAGVWVEDLQTPNGTFLDGESIQRAQWMAGSSLTLGKNGPEFRLVKAARAAAGTSAPTYVESSAWRPGPPKNAAQALTERRSVPTLTEPLEEMMPNRELTIVRNLLVLTIICCVALGVMLVMQNKEIQENRRALGQMQEQGQNAIGTFMPQLNQRLNQFDGKLDGFNHRMDGMDAQMQQSEDRFVKRLDTEMPLIMDRYLANKAKNNGMQVQLGSR